MEQYPLFVHSLLKASPRSVVENVPRRSLTPVPVWLSPPAAPATRRTMQAPENLMHFLHQRLRGMFETVIWQRFLQLLALALLRPLTTHRDKTSCPSRHKRLLTLHTKQHLLNNPTSTVFFKPFLNIDQVPMCHSSFPSFIS